MAIWANYVSGAWNGLNLWGVGVAAPNGIGAVANFNKPAPNGGAAIASINLVGAITLGRLDMTSNSIGAYDITGGTLTMSGPSAQINTVASGVIRPDANIISANLQLNSTTTITTATELDISGNITGDVGIAIIKAGLGKLKLIGPNDWHGGMTINAGTVEIDDDLGFGVGGSGTGEITIAGNSAIRAVANATLANHFVQNAGVTTTISAAAGKTLTFSDFNAKGGAGASFHFGTATDTGTIAFVTGYPSSGFLTQFDSIFIDGGALLADKLGGFAPQAASGVTIAAGATLDVNGFGPLGVRSLQGAGVVVNNAPGNAFVGELELQGGNSDYSGALVDGVSKLRVSVSGGAHLLSGANTYSGDTTLLHGVLRAGAVNTLSAASKIVFFNADAALDLNGFDQTILKLESGNLANGGSIVNGAANSAATLTINDPAAGLVKFFGVMADGAGILGLTKKGQGVQMLANANTYSGVTNINSGALALYQSGSIANSSSVNVASGAVLDVSNINVPSTSIKTLNNQGVVYLGTITGSVKTLILISQATDLTGVFASTAGTISNLVVDIAPMANFSAAGADFSGVGNHVWTDGTDTITINGNSLANTLTGSDHADLINGGAGTDTLNGGLGDDTLNGATALAGQFNLLNGGIGNDAASYAGTAATVYADLNTQAGIVGGVLTDLYTCIESVIGGDNNDTLNGDGLDNRLSGGLGDDLLFGNLGNDTLTGGGHVAGSFNQLFGGAGVDTVDYSAETNKVFVDLRAPAGHIDIGAGYVLSDLMNSIENVIGGSNDDILVGTDSDANLILGGAGTDLLFGFDGNDTLVGGSANSGQYNQLWAGIGLDTASYAGTTSVVYADLNVLAGWVTNAGNALVLTDVYNSVENLTGGSAGDSLVGNHAANIITGGGAADILYANTGAGFDNSIDRFVYANTADSNLTTGYDTIKNFRAAEDLLDFSAFHITAAQVSIASGGGATSVYANTNGIAGFDLALVVLGNNALTTADIVF